MIDGLLVKRLRRRPLTAKTWVRFPYGSPIKKRTLFWVFAFLLVTRTAIAATAKPYGFESTPSSASSLLGSRRTEFPSLPKFVVCANHGCVDDLHLVARKSARLGENPLTDSQYHIKDEIFVFFHNYLLSIFPITIQTSGRTSCFVI